MHGYCTGHKVVLDGGVREVVRSEVDTSHLSKLTMGLPYRGRVPCAGLYLQGQGYSAVIPGVNLLVGHMPERRPHLYRNEGSVSKCLARDTEARWKKDVRTSLEGDS